MIFQVHENHGRHIAYSDTEAKRNNENGWKTVSKDEFYGILEVEDTDRDALAKLYEEKFGKKPHHKAKNETIQAALEDE